MSLFRDFMEVKSHNKVSVVLENYEQGLQEKLKLVKDVYVECDEAEKIAIEEILLSQRYPRINSLMIALESLNPQKIHAACKVYENWYGSLPNTLHDYKVKALTRSQSTLSEEDTLRLLSNKTSQNMHKISKIVEMTINRIPKWRSKVIVQPDLPEGKAWMEPVEKGIVEVHRPPCFGKIGCALLPGGLELWVIDEQEMDLDKGLQEDFCALMEGLMYPVSPVKKLMTVYFPAKVSERSIYKEARRRLALFGNAEILPPAMKVTIDEDNYVNDIWKARIDSGYLVETASNLFEAVGHAEIPIRYIELIREGTG